MDHGSTMSPVALGIILRYFVGSQDPRLYPSVDLITAQVPCHTGLILRTSATCSPSTTPTHLALSHCSALFSLLPLGFPPCGCGLVSSLQNHSDALDGVRYSPGPL